MSESQEPTKRSAIKIALAIIPAVLILSICIALYLGANADQEESQPVEGDITVPEMADYLSKLERLIGERRTDTEAGQKAFRQLNAMTAGTLGPENLGYQVNRYRNDSAEGLLWSTLWVDTGNRESREKVVIAIPQAGADAAPAFAFGFVEFLSNYSMEMGLRVVFYPPLVEGDLADWIWKRCGDESSEMVGFLKVDAGPPKDRESVIVPSAASQEILTEMQGSKIWSDEVVVLDEVAPYVEVRLVGRGIGSREDQAKRLIRLMPIVKALAERLGQKN